MHLPMPLNCVSLQYENQCPEMKRKQIRLCIWTLAALIAIFVPCWLIRFTTVTRPVAVELKAHSPHLIWFRPLPGPVTTNRGALKSEAPDTFSPHIGRFPIDGWSKEQVTACFGTPARQINVNVSLVTFCLAPRFDSCWAYGDTETMALIWFRNDKAIYGSDLFMVY